MKIEAIKLWVWLLSIAIAINNDWFDSFGIDCDQKLVLSFCPNTDKLNDKICL